jgi:hypothetical protein
MNEGKTNKEINMSTASVQLMKVKDGSEGQMWQPHLWGPGARKRGEFFLYTRISQQDKTLSHLLTLFDRNGDFGKLDNESHQAKYNRVGVHYNTGGGEHFWKIEKLVNGKYRISSFFSNEEFLKKSVSNPSKENWNERRSLAAYKMPNGQVKLRHVETSNSPEQMWEFKELKESFTNH